MWSKKHKTKLNKNKEYEEKIKIACYMFLACSSIAICQSHLFFGNMCLHAQTLCLTFSNNGICQSHLFTHFFAFWKCEKYTCLSPSFLKQKGNSNSYMFPPSFPWTNVKSKNNTCLRSLSYPQKHVNWTSYLLFFARYDSTLLSCTCLACFHSFNDLIEYTLSIFGAIRMP